MVFQELAPSQSHKIKNRHDLEFELFSDTSPVNGASRIRANEGEAAEHGIYYDDTEYDYMQHIRDLNSGGGDGESFFIEAKIGSKDKKGKEKMSLEAALREANLQEERSESGASKADSLLSEDILPSMDLRQASYQDQQDVPDALAGFQPDMDPRLREVLEALDDDAYVDDEEEFFGKITRDGEEVSQDEFGDADLFDGAEDDGWESDTTEKPSKEFAIDNPMSNPSSSADVPMSDALPPDHGDGDWMKEFSKFKSDQKSTPKAPKPQIPADVQSSLLTGATSLTGARRKKRKGAMTSSTGYSMTSSSLARTEGLTLLDARFDKIEEEYADDDGMELDMDDTASMFSKNSRASNVSRASGTSNLSSMSQAPELTTAGFEGMMDDFLGGYSMSGKRRVKKGGYQSGLEQLDEVRRELGPARVRAQKA